MGRAVWITERAGRANAGVALAAPYAQPPRARHASTSSGPAARWMAPSTPPPPSSDWLAAFTTASTSRPVMSALIASTRTPTVCFPHALARREPIGHDHTVVITSVVWQGRE